MQRHKLVALSLGSHEIHLAQAAEIHRIDNGVVFGKCCRGSSIIGMVVGVLSSTSGSRA